MEGGATCQACGTQVVNIEWPGFAAPELPMLDEDRALDAESNNPGQQQVWRLVTARGCAVRGTRPKSCLRVPKGN